MVDGEKNRNFGRSTKTKKNTSLSVVNVVGSSVCTIPLTGPDFFSSKNKIIKTPSKSLLPQRTNNFSDVLNRIAVFPRHAKVPKRLSKFRRTSGKFDIPRAPSPVTFDAPLYYICTSKLLRYEWNTYDRGNSFPSLSVRHLYDFLRRSCVTGTLYTPPVRSSVAKVRAILCTIIVSKLIKIVFAARYRCFAVIRRFGYFEINAYTVR